MLHQEINIGQSVDLTSHFQIPRALESVEFIQRYWNNFAWTRRTDLMCIASCRNMLIRCHSGELSEAHVSSLQKPVEFIHLATTTSFIWLKFANFVHRASWWIKPSYAIETGTELSFLYRYSNSASHHCTINFRLKMKQLTFIPLQVYCNPDLGKTWERTNDRDKHISEKIFSSSGI
jgi:hypothetical protein